MRTTRGSSIAVKPRSRGSLRRCLKPAVARGCSTWLLVAALASCGGAHASDPAAGTVALDETSAVAFAHAVNLRAGDAPSMEVLGPEAAAPSPGTKAVGFARCDGAPSPTRHVANMRSVLLWRGDGRDWHSVISRVTVMPSKALAARNLAAFSSPRGLRCERPYGGVSISSLELPLPGGARAVGVRILAREKGVRRTPWLTTTCSRSPAGPPKSSSPPPALPILLPFESSGVCSPPCTVAPRQPAASSSAIRRRLSRETPKRRPRASGTDRSGTSRRARIRPAGATRGRPPAAP